MYQNVLTHFDTFWLAGVCAQLAAASCCIYIARLGEADDILLDGWRREHVTEQARTKVLVLNSGHTDASPEGKKSWSCDKTYG